MTSSTHSITPLRQRMIDDMRMRKLAPKTQAAYIRAVRQLAGCLDRSPDTATVEDLRRYQLHLVDHGMSPGSLNDHRTQVLLRDHARSREAAGEDAAGACPAQAASGAEP